MRVNEIKTQQTKKLHDVVIKPGFTQSLHLDKSVKDDFISMKLSFNEPIRVTCVPSEPGHRVKHAFKSEIRFPEFMILGLENGNRSLTIKMLERDTEYPYGLFTRNCTFVLPATDRVPLTSQLVSGEDCDVNIKLDGNIETYVA